MCVGLCNAYDLISEPSDRPSGDFLPIITTALLNREPYPVLPAFLAGAHLEYRPEMVIILTGRVTERLLPIERGGSCAITQITKDLLGNHLQSICICRITDLFALCREIPRALLTVTLRDQMSVNGKSANGESD